MIARLLIYGDDEEDTDYVDFHFVAMDIQAGYRSMDGFQYCVVIGGSIYELVYSIGLQMECERVIKFKDGYNNML